MTPRNLDDGIGTIADHLEHPRPRVAHLAADGWRDCAEELGHARARLRDMQDAMRRELTDTQLAAVVADYRRRQRTRGAVEAELARTVGGGE